MLTINELAKRSGLAPQIVRYYVRIGLIEADGRRENGYRLFGLHNVKLLRFIRAAKNLGFTLNEIKQITERAEQGESPCPDVRSIIRHRIRENRAKLDAMLSLQNRMEQALEQWNAMPDSLPDGGSICRLVESVDAAMANGDRELLCHQLKEVG